jgi:DNA-binding FrmR family transcriptional regulator
MNAAQPAKIRLKPEARRAAVAGELVTRLRRAEGQLRGLERMVGANAYCIDLLQQLSAVRRALDRVALLLVRDHLRTCVRSAMSEGRVEESVAELVAVLDRFLA